MRGIAPRRSILQGLAVTMTVTPKFAAGRSCTRIFGVRNVALSFCLSYGSVKVEHRVRLALTRICFADRRFGFFTLRCMVRRLGIAPNERKPRSLYRRARLFNGIPPRNGCRGRSCTGKERLMRPFGELSLPAIWSQCPATLRTVRFTGPH